MKKNSLLAVIFKLIKRITQKSQIESSIPNFENLIFL